MRIDVITIFPDYLAPLDLSLVGRARRAGLVNLEVHDLRRWTHDPHRTVDDAPYGGGAGMVMRPEPWTEALADLGETSGYDEDAASPVLVVPTPAGRLLTQDLAEELSKRPRLLFACGRYEGIDQRVLDAATATMPVMEVSVGDYVLSGGEAAALVLIEATVRLLPGVVGNPESLTEESHAVAAGGRLLEYPVYTKPRLWRGREVPEVLLSGNHARIARWRRDQALRRTAIRRPDLLPALDAPELDPRDREVIADAGGPTGDGSLADADPHARE